MTENSGVTESSDLTESAGVTDATGLAGTATLIAPVLSPHQRHGRA